jgi:hypothetical protein
MASNNHHHELKLSKFEAPQNLKTAAYVCVVLGLIGMIMGFINNPERVWTAYLVSFFYFACLALGAMFFIAFQLRNKRRMEHFDSSYR